ncbi:O-antigen ligase family protein [uncultured Desulfobacter sp.]|uniref:O-antigen ligase family protein n=1 Tax=uncultured Desulfobacter sp. TaxID=240139 RepID=UPI0029C6316B|nr:O-antigen ligase family protein [uncultured Desulfobacter sp.]
MKSVLLKTLSIVCFFIVVSSVWDYPYHPGILFCFLTGYAFLLFRFSKIWLFFLPVFLPILDFAPLSGRFFFDEFDIFLLATIGVKLWEGFAKSSKTNFLSLKTISIALFSISIGISTLIGFFPLQPIDLNSFSNYYSHYNALRVFKGFGWAIAVIPCLSKDLTRQITIKKYLVPGILTGFTFTSLYVVWERQVFPGLINFDSAVRAVGPFSGMHIGGAYIDAYFATTLPFVMSVFFFYKNPFIRMGGLGLFLIGFYSLIVTFSRIVYFASAMSAIVFLIYFLFINQSKRRFFITLFGVVSAICLIVIPVFKGTFINHRFSHTLKDVRLRFEHYIQGIEMMDNTFFSNVFGMGLGTYPRIYAERSMENEEPSYYSYISERNNTFLRLESYGFIYIDQKIALKPYQTYRLKVDIKTNVEEAKLTVAICEKTALNSFNCCWLPLKTLKKTGKWVTYEKQFNSKNVGVGNPLYQRRPVYLSLFNGQRGSIIDVDNLSLVDNNGKNLVKNGDFASGSDFWFFTADNHLPWHIKNLWMHLYFEQGLFGLVLFVIFISYCIGKLIKYSFKGDAYSVIFLSSMVGFLSVGVVDSMFDFPRLTLYFFFLCFVALNRPKILSE